MTTKTMKTFVLVIRKENNLTGKCTTVIKVVQTLHDLLAMKTSELDQLALDLLHLNPYIHSVSVTDVIEGA
jgi:hypothetical protein